MRPSHLECSTEKWTWSQRGNWISKLFLYTFWCQGESEPWNADSSSLSTIVFVAWASCTVPGDQNITSIIYVVSNIYIYHIHVWQAINVLGVYWIYDIQFNMYKYSISYYGATSGCISFLPRLTFSRLKGKAKKKGLLVIWAVACIEQSHAAVSDDSNPQPFTFLNSDFTIVLVASYQCAGRLGFAQSKWNVRSFVLITRYVVVKHWATLKFTNDLRSIILFQIVRKLFDYLKTSCQPPNVGKTNARL